MSMFPPIENLKQFKHHLGVTLSKFQEPCLHDKAWDEMRDLMTEHITNTDRMNTFLASLAEPGKNLIQRREMAKMYGKAAEIFQESLLTFVNKIILFIQKLLKENEQQLHLALAQSLGKAVKYIVGNNKTVDSCCDQLNYILRILYQNMAVPNVVLQTGTSLCLDQVFQNIQPEALRRIGPLVTTKMCEILMSKYCKCQANVLDAIGSILHVLMMPIYGSNFNETIDEPFFQTIDGQESATYLFECLLQHVSHADWQARRSSVASLSKLAKNHELLTFLQTQKQIMIEHLTICKSDKFKPVREAACEALSIVKCIPDPTYSPIRRHPDGSSRELLGEDAIVLGNPGGVEQNNNLDTFSPHQIKQEISNQEGDRSNLIEDHYLQHATGEHEFQLNPSSSRELLPPRKAGAKPRGGGPGTLQNLKKPKRNTFGGSKAERPGRFSPTEAHSRKRPGLLHDQGRLQRDIVNVRSANRLHTLGEQSARERSQSRGRATRSDAGGRLLSQATQKKIRQRNEENNKLQFHHSCQINRAQPKQKDRWHSSNRCSIFLRPRNNGFFENQQQIQSDVEIFEPRNQSPHVGIASQDENQRRPHSESQSPALVMPPSEDPRLLQRKQDSLLELVEAHNPLQVPLGDPSGMESAQFELVEPQQQTREDDRFRPEEVSALTAQAQIDFSQSGWPNDSAVDPKHGTGTMHQEPANGTPGENFNQRRQSHKRAHWNQSSPNLKNGAPKLDTRSQNSSEIVQNIDQYISKYGKEYARKQEERKSARSNIRAGSREDRSQRSVSQMSGSQHASNYASNHASPIAIAQQYPSVMNQNIVRPDGDSLDAQEPQPLSSEKQRSGFVKESTGSAFQNFQRLNHIITEGSEGTDTGDKLLEGLSRQQKHVKQKTAEASALPPSYPHHLGTQYGTYGATSPLLSDAPKADNEKAFMDYSSNPGRTQGYIGGSRDQPHSQTSHHNHVQVVDDFSSQFPMSIQTKLTNTRPMERSEGLSSANGRHLRPEGEEEPKQVSQPQFILQDPNAETAQFDHRKPPLTQPPSASPHLETWRPFESQQEVATQVDKLTQEVHRLAELNSQLAERLVEVETQSSQQIGLLSTKVLHLEDMLQRVLQQQELPQPKSKPLPPPPSEPKELGYEKVQSEQRDVRQELERTARDGEWLVHEEVIPWPSKHHASMEQARPQTSQVASLEKKAVALKEVRPKSVQVGEPALGSINQKVDICLITQNLKYLDDDVKADPKEFALLSERNVGKMITFVLQKLTVQKGRWEVCQEKMKGYRLDESPSVHKNKRIDLQSHFEPDHQLIDGLLEWAHALIQHCFEKVERESAEFLDLIQLLIDLLKEGSMLTVKQRTSVSEIYQVIATKVGTK